MTRKNIYTIYFLYTMSGPTMTRKNIYAIYFVYYEWTHHDKKNIYTVQKVYTMGGLTMTRKIYTLYKKCTQWVDLP
jgi:hypothetical protein